MVSDAELVSLCQQGQQAAFAELVERYEKKVYNLAYRMLGNGEDARELVQEAFLKGYYALPDFRGDASFSTWLYRIATNLCLDVLRRRKNKIAFSLDEPLETEKGTLERQLPAEEEGPEVIVERRELQIFIQELIGTLPPEQRLVLVMREFQELTYEEIAAALQCSLGTVKSRLSRARRALKEKLLASGEPFGSTLRQKQGKGGSRV